MNQFEDAFKKYEQLTERTQQAFEFWINHVLASVKEFYKVK
jgi:hypothetical protein